MYCLKLNTDGAIEKLNMDKGDTYEQAREILGGLIELVNPSGLPDPYILLVDEEGIIKELKFNPLASILYGFAEHGTPILGTALILRTVMTYDGLDLAPLNERDIEKMQEVLCRLLGG